MATPESKVKRRFTKTVRARGWGLVNPIGGAYAEAGVTDHLINADGWFGAIEAKANAPVPTELQMEFILDTAMRGGFAGAYGGKPLSARSKFGKAHIDLVGSYAWAIANVAGRQVTLTAREADLGSSLENLFDMIHKVNTHKIKLAGA